MSYSYDPEIEAFIPYAPPIDATQPEAVRQMLAEAAAQMPAWEPSPHTDYQVHEVPGYEGAPTVAAHVLRRPAEKVSNAPAVIWFHGGGFIFGSAAEGMPFLEPVVLNTGAVAVSVNYRLSPETKYPGALDDGYAVYTWLRDNAESLGVDPHRIAVGGQSAGGTLATALAMRIRDEGGKILFQVLDIPVTDDRGTTDSARDYHDSLVWNRPNAEASWKHYLGELAEPIPAYAAPNRAEDLSGMPPAFIAVNQFDPTRDEAIEYARRLAHAGVQTELHVYPGTFHGSSSMAVDAAVSRRHIGNLHAAYARAFATEPQGT